MPSPHRTHLLRRMPRQTPRLDWRTVLLALSLLMATFALSAESAAAQTPANPTTQIGFILDGSGSIGSSNWSTIRTGLATALRDSQCVPQDGSVELTLTVFSSSATVEIDPTVIANATVANTIANQVATLSYPGGSTNIAEALVDTAQGMRNSPNFLATRKQAINLVTDGEPNRTTAVPGGCAGYPNSDRGNTECARDYLLSHLQMTGDQDELDSEFIGSQGSNSGWLRTNIVYPQPGSYADLATNTFIDGWVLIVPDAAGFAAAVCQKFQQIINEDVTVTKQVIGANAPAGAEFDVTLTCGAESATFSLQDGESGTLQTVPAGTICSVTEADPGNDWLVTLPQDLTVVQGVDNSLTVTNEYVATRPVTVTKAVTGANIPAGAEFDVTLACGGLSQTFTLQDGQSGTLSDVPVDSVCTVTETPGAAWELVGVVPSPLTVTAAGPNAMVVTNRHRTGTLEVRKDVVPDATATNWEIDVAGPTSFTDTLTGDDTTGVRTVNIGAYTITESAGAGSDPSLYDSGYSCTVNGQSGPSGTGVSITNLTISDGQAVICVFTNTRKTGSITLVKDADPDDNTAFPFSVPPAFTAGGTVTFNGSGSQTVSNVPTGSYTFTEQTPAGWILTAIECSGGQTSVTAPSVTIELGANDDVTCTFRNRKPGLDILKSPAQQIIQPGERADFTIAVSNSGTVELTNVTVSDEATPDCVRTFATLAPGATETYACSLDNVQQSFTNTAVADSDQTAETNDEAIVLLAALEISKEFVDFTDNDVSSDISVGDDLNYQIVVTNVGDATLNNVTVSDSLIAGLTCTPGAPVAALIPTAAITCTGSYTVQQGDVNVGQVDNRATAASEETDPIEATEEVVIPQNPALALDKAYTGYSDNDDSGDVSVGDRLNYTLVAANRGNVTLTNVTVSDTLLTNLSCTPTVPTATLAPQAEITCTGNHLVMQANVDAGGVRNTASADSDQTPPVEDSANVTIPADPALTMEKSYEGFIDNDASNAISVNDELTYKISVTNVGNITLHNVSVSDSLIAGLTCTPAVPATALAPDAVITCTGSYTVGQADLDRGRVDNTAQADSDETDRITDDVAVLIPQNPALTIEKSYTGFSDNDSSGDISLNDALNYAIVVTNAGNVTLNAVEVDDSLLSNLACTPTVPATTLAPGGVITCSGSHTVGQGDMNRGRVDNTATANSQETGEVEDTATAPIGQTPVLVLEKSYLGNDDEDESNSVSAGDTLRYAIVARNIGNVTLTGVTVIDSLLAAPLTCVPATPTTLNPQEEITCSGSYSVTQANVDAGQILNTATADSNETEPIDDSALVVIPAQPGLKTQKALVGNADEDGSATVSLGDTLTYSLRVTNIGNITLTGVTLSDPRLPALTCTPAQPALLAPGATLACTGDYVVTQADVDAGEVVNTAVGASNETDPDPDSETTPIPRNPGLATEKRLAANDDADSSGNVSVGDTLTYEISATNIGDVTLTSVTLRDPMIATLSCTPAQPATLAPGEAMVCSGAYVVTQADADAGSILNTAVGDSAETEPDPASETVAVPQRPSIILAKRMAELDDADGSGAPTLGDTLNYELTATNNGNVTLSNVIVTDPLLGSLSCAPAQPATLAPGEVMVCSGVHVITQADVDAGRVLNTATAVGEFENGQEVSDDDTVNTPVQAPTAISLSSFGAIWVGETVEVHWNTALELSTWGYYLYRSATADFDAANRITQSMIMGQGESGGSYVYVDTDVVVGNTYYYWLVEIQNGVGAAPYGPVRITAGGEGNRLFLPIVTQ